MRRRYAEAWQAFWKSHTALGQIVEEDFPDPERPDAEPTRYDLDAVWDLAARLAALEEGYERRT